MKRSTAYNHLRRFESKLNGLYVNARLSKESHASLLQEMQRFWQEVKEAKLPGWCISSLMTLREYLSRQHYNALVWAFPASNGQIKPYESLSDDDRMLVHNGTIQGGHYYYHDRATQTTTRDGTETTITTIRTITPCRF